FQLSPNLSQHSSRPPNPLLEARLVFSGIRIIFLFGPDETSKVSAIPKNNIPSEHRN
ncbi:hypothetical protein AVEN_112169-1, partial [Araneus ventricosus]